MKKLNLLSRAEMKNVMGGVEAVGVCSDGSWVNADMGICFNCCLAYERSQPLPLDPNYNEFDTCDSLCSR
ncbi:MAG: hypothetical protein EOO43_19820 [Flavobacterium sp.]|nr:MAG: hypothetical protein EOO43_19820 [Flavobacterium sp.]